MNEQQRAGVANWVERLPMRRVLAIAIALVALVAAGFFWTRDTPVAIKAAPPAASVDIDDDAPLVAPVRFSPLATIWSMFDFIITVVR